jgi:heme oxygenase (staphylobilin-producing)
MFVATNRLRILKGHGRELEERFRRGGAVAREPGFWGFELWKLESEAEHEEHLVVTHWESKEAHNRWVQSEAFKRAHSGPPADFIVGPGEVGSYEVRLSYGPET